MPSTRLAVALTALVVLAGCSMVPGVGDDGSGAATTTTREPPDDHKLVFASFTGGVPFTANVTVTRAGETVYEKTLQRDGNGTYLNLTSLAANQSYTVTVNTTIPAVGGGNMSQRFTVAGRAGHATVIRVAWQGLFAHTLRLPRGTVGKRFLLTSFYSPPPGESDTVEVDLRVWYRGKQVFNDTVSVDDDSQGVRPTKLGRKGVYRVKVRGKTGGWVEKVFVVTDSNTFVKIRLDSSGSVDMLRLGSWVKTDRLPAD